MIWGWTPQFVIVQLLGILIIGCCVIAPHMKTKSGILMWNIAATMLIAVEMLILWKLAAAATAAIAVVRGVVFYVYTTKNQRSPQWLLWLFIAAHLASVFVFWEGWISALLIIGALNNYGQWQDDLNITRSVVVIITIPLGIYNVLAGAYTGATNEFLQTISASISLLTNYRRRDTVKA